MMDAASDVPKYWRKYALEMSAAAHQFFHYHHAKESYFYFVNKPGDKTRSRHNNIILFPTRVLRAVHMLLDC